MLKHLKPLIPEFTHYIEPFVGGGALFFDLLPVSATINDNDPYVYHFFNKLVEKDEKFLGQILGNIIQWKMSQDMGTEKKFYYAHRTIFNDYITHMPQQYDHVRICSWWLLQQLSFGGMIRYNKKGHFNVPYGHYNKKNLEKQYKAICDFAYSKIKPVVFNFDFAELEETVYINAMEKDDKVFIFLDPPYLTPFNDYGSGSFHLKDYIKLRNWLEKFKDMPNVKWLMIVSYHPHLDATLDVMSEYATITSIDGRFAFNIKNRFSTKTKYIIVRNY